MQALTSDGTGHVALRDKPFPNLEHPRDAIIRVTSAGLCGSVLHLAYEVYGTRVERCIKAAFFPRHTGDQEVPRA